MSLTVQRTWRLAPGVADYRPRLDAINARWRGTPYRAGQQVAGVGVDCMRYVCAVLDELHRRPASPVDAIPPDAAMHDREGAIAAMHAMVSRFRPCEFVHDEWLEPGDVVLVGPKLGAPGHALLVGTEPHVYWHASSEAGSVCRVGSSYLERHPIGYVLRSSARKGWA